MNQRVTRENRSAFWDRMRQEGRCEQAASAYADLLSTGMLKRQAQATLVARFQPLDGSRTRAWDTPDSWACGRTDWKKPGPDIQEQYEQDLMWVYRNRDKPLEQAPSQGARMLLETAQKKPERFLCMYQKTLPAITDRQQNLLMDRRRSVASRRAARQAAIELEKERKNKEERKLRRAEEARQAQIKRQEQERLEAERQEQVRQEAARKEQERLEHEQNRKPAKQRLVSVAPDREVF